MDVECGNRLHNQSVETVKWEAMQNEKWGPYRLPFISSLKRNLPRKKHYNLCIQIA